VEPRQGTPPRIAGGEKEPLRRIPRGGPEPDETVSRDLLLQPARSLGILAREVQAHGSRGFRTKDGSCLAGTRLKIAFAKSGSERLR